jgi:two-component system, cell cycle sensor histidine kinase and response regulator CckA
MSDTVSSVRTAGASPARVADRANARRSSRTAAVWSIAAPVSILLGTVFLGILASQQREDVAHEWEGRLSEMVEDRRAAIERWVGDGLAEAGVAAAFPSVEALFAGRPSGRSPFPADPEAAGHLAHVLTLVADMHRFRTVMVLSPAGRTLAAAEGRPPAEEACRSFALQMLRRGAPLAGFHAHGERPVVGFAAPVRGMGGSELGAVLVETDPREFLYPLLASDPLLTRTGETLLVAQDGAAALFLSPLRHHGDPPLTWRRPLANPNFPARRALESDPDFGWYRDYRGEPVLAATRRIRNAPWGLVAKVDQVEARATARQRLLSTAVMTASFFLALIGLGYGRWRSQKAAFQGSVARSEARFASLLQRANDAIFFVAPDGEVRDCNHRAETLYGYSRDELLALRIQDLQAKDVGEPVETLLLRVVESDGLVFEAVHVRRDGERLNVEVSGRGEGAGADRVSLFIVRDVTERVRSAEELERQREILETIVDHIPVMVMMFDPRGRPLLVNREFERVIGFSQEELPRVDMLAHCYPDPADRRRVVEFVRRAGSGWEDFRTRVRDGRTIDTTWATVRLGDGTLVSIGRDVTAARESERALRETQAQLIQAQKMEAVGRLAGGVAHDFNNILNVILGYGELMLRGLSDSDPHRRHVGEIRKAADRAASLTRQLLAFSRKQVLTPKILDLNVVVTDIEKMLRRLIGEDVELVTLLHPELGSVLADPGQMEQVLMNLAVNARDAMPAGGKITIETANVMLDPLSIRWRPGLSPGPHVMLMLSDTGHGMSREVQDRIFEPFFTTKEQGKGTGLGLSTVYGIVKQSEGSIWVYSEEGRGTSIKVYLPRVSQRPIEIQPVAAPGRGGHETVLLVEDDDSMRDLACEVLGSAGYRVLAAPNGEAALELASEHERIELLVTDVVMPGMDGRQLSRVLLSRRPRLRVLFASGYTADALSQHGILEDGLTFLPKPFTAEALTTKVRQALDARD